MMTAATTAPTARPTPAWSMALVPRPTSLETQLALDCWRVTRWTSRNTKAASTNRAAATTWLWWAANSDAKTKTVPAGTTASNGTHNRNAAQSATNAAHHKHNPEANRNGVD